MTISDMVLATNIVTLVLFLSVSHKMIITVIRDWKKLPKPRAPKILFIIIMFIFLWSVYAVYLSLLFP